MKRLHFSLGPVQSFVSQARRTRDLWAGSFLLSYLTGHAMQAVLDHGGLIEFPVVTGSSSNISDPLLQAISAHGSATSAQPHIGSLPNRFVAQVADSFQPLWCTEAISRQWHEAAQAVWIRYIAPISQLGQDTEMIWKRQIANFWEITWVMGDDMDLLDRRKNWRTQSYPQEVGRKCSMMPQWQEISGHVDTPARKKFWLALRETLALDHQDLELQDGEELSAIALVKRLFPLVANEAIGWSVPVSYRSTVDLAATSWVTHVCRTQSHYCEDYAKTGRIFIQSKDPLPIAWQRIATENPRVRPFMQMDANSWHVNTLLNDRLWKEEQSPSLRNRLAQVLQQFASSPDTYYAILLMDGDRLGQLLKTHPSRTISAALKDFTQGVPDIVQQRNGELIYAGGDDVLALFPIEDTLAASIALRKHYAGVMKGRGTISGAIVYAHYHAPLTELIRNAHHLLDNIAKRQNERDSLALSVMTSAGASRTWATKWDVLQPSALNRLEYLATQVQAAMSSQFLFKISELESRLGHESFGDDDFWQHLFVYELTRSLSVSQEHQNSQEQRHANERLSRMIVELSHGYWVKTDNSRYQDLLSLIHFLSKRMRSDV